MTTPTNEYAPQKNWRLERDTSTAHLILDAPGKEVNTLTEAVLRELDTVLENLQNDSSVTGLVLRSGKKDFIVGADIGEIAAFKTAEAATAGSRAMQQILQRLADFKVPTVAAIHGQCLGGGLELAMACHWRVATSDNRTKLGLPEIQLGLIPGAGGTQRLPKLVGVQTALDMILTGKRLSGKKAEKAGLVDACVPEGRLLEEANKLSGQKRRNPSRMHDLAPSKLASDLPKWAAEGNPFGRKLIAKKAREMVDEKTKGFYPASYKALDAVFEGYDLPLARGLELEANLFGQLAMTRESRSLVHLFHATTALKKHPYRDAGRERFGKTKVGTVGVIGAGFMGGGIATVCVDRNIRVLLSDPNKDSIGRTLKHIRSYFQKKLDRRRIKPFELNQRMAHVSPGLNPEGFGKTDIVIEAVFEDLKLKKKILAQVESQAGKDFIFASNTSALPISDVAQDAKHPERVIGMHFFSPVEKMPLLEVIVTKQTADWVTARTVDLGQELGKQVIIVKDGPGFYTTRALSFFLNEAAILLQEGAAIEQVDRVLTDFGFPVGPVTLIDEVGIDVGIHVLETMQKAFPERMTLPKGLAPIIDSGRLGRKNNKGFYTYDTGDGQNGKKGRPDPAIYELIGANRQADKISEQEILDRCLLVFVNECVRCLDDEILASAADGDVGAVFGLGFPPFWGGPFKYIDHVGAAGLVERLRDLASRHGARFQPAKSLVKMAESGQRFFTDEA